MVDPASSHPRLSQSSPGLLGYVIAVALSFLALVVQCGYMAYLDGEEYWTFTRTASAVLFIGFVPAAVIGGSGAAIVHLLTRRLSSQWPAILLAGLAGLLVGLAMFPDDLRFMGWLAIDAAGGRLAVAPMARRRKQHSPLPDAAECGSSAEVESPRPQDQRVRLFAHREREK